MPACPNCKQDIEYLVHTCISRTRDVGKLSLDKGDVIDNSEVLDITDDQFTCPKCGYAITSLYHEAQDFLRQQSIPQAFATVA